MTITKLPKKQKIDEAKADAFISGVSLKTAPAPVLAQPSRTAPEKVVVNLRFDPLLLERVDASARARGVSRTAWLHWAAAEMLGERN
jgi:hypothetical protein